MKQREIRKLEKMAIEAGGSVTDKPNKLHQITHQTVPKKRPKINLVGRTILVKNGEVL